MNSNNPSKASTSYRSLTGLTIKPSTPHKLQRRRLNPHGFVGCVESYSDITSASASAGVEKGPGTMKNYAAGSVSVSFTSEEVVKEMRCDVAIRTVHVGDCMGILVRDEDIVWRTEEMWWNVRRFSPSLPFLFPIVLFLVPLPVLPLLSFFFPHLPLLTAYPSSLSFPSPFLA